MTLQESAVAIAGATLDWQTYSGAQDHMQDWLSQYDLVEHLMVLSEVGVAQAVGQSYLQCLVFQYGAIVPAVPHIHVGITEDGANGQVVGSGVPLNHWQLAVGQVVSYFMLVQASKAAAVSGICLGWQKSSSPWNSFPVDHMHLAWVQASLLVTVMHF